MLDVEVQNRLGLLDQRSVGRKEAGRLEQAERYLVNAGQQDRVESVSDEADDLLSNIRFGRGETDGIKGREAKAKVASLQRGLELGNRQLESGQQTLIDSGLHTRIYYVALDGFDTHSQQPDAHANLPRPEGVGRAIQVG